MKKLFALALAAALMISLVACGGEKKTYDNRLEEILDRGYIPVATEPYFAPNEFIDPSKEGDEKYVGSDIELAKYIADKLGVECRIVPLEFTEVLSSVSYGKYDLAISALSYTPDRAESMNLSKGYYTNEDTEGYGFMVRADKRDNYPTPESFKDAVLVVQKGSLQEALINDQIPEYKEIKYVSSMEDSFLMVKEGKADAAACYIGNARIWAEKNGDVDIAKDFKFNVDDFSGTRIGMLKGEDELTERINEIIDELVESGQYKTWYNDYSDYARQLGID